MTGITWLRHRHGNALGAQFSISIVLPMILPITLMAAGAMFVGALPARAFDSAQRDQVRSRAETRPEGRIDLAIQVLLRIPTGKAEIEKALATWNIDRPENLSQVIKPGDVSRTDAVLTRHYDPQTGKETREREVTIYINTSQSLTNVVLDLAHEMVHATSRPAFDPYDPNLTPAQYIHSAIDGVGGEVQAVAQECRVARELSKNFDIPLKRCRNYFNVSSGSGQEMASQPDIKKIRRDFYRVGQWNNDLLQILGAEATLLPDLSPEPPQLYSSTGNAPYPVALLKEYEALTRIACENSRRRIVTQSASQPNAISGSATTSFAGRAPASLHQPQSGVQSVALDDATSIFLQRRCH